MTLGGSLGNPLCLVEWKRASSRVEAGMLGFLSISNSDHRVPAKLAQESQAWCSAEEWNSAYLSSCSGGYKPLVVLCVELRVFRKMHGGVRVPSCCAFIHRVAFEEVSGHRVLLKSGLGNRDLSACGTIHEATSRISS